MKTVLILLLVGFLSACNHEEPLEVVIDIDPDTRICQLDNTGQAHIKCWGSCGAVAGSCKIRWRALGSTDPWENNGDNTRKRDEERDSELEYACYCK